MYITQAVFKTLYSIQIQILRYKTILSASIDNLKMASADCRISKTSYNLSESLNKIQCRRHGKTTIFMDMFCHLKLINHIGEHMCH